MLNENHFTDNLDMFLKELHQVDNFNGTFYFIKTYSNLLNVKGRF